MNIIVTGGAGFIGSNFIFHMLKKIPGLPHHLSGLSDLCRKPFHSCTCHGQPKFPFCKRKHYRQRSCL